MHPELLPVGANSWVVRWAVLRRTGFAFQSWAQLGASRDYSNPQQVLHQGRLSLRALCRDPRFLEAVLLSSPAAHDRLRSLAEAPFSPIRNHETRRRERLAAAYLQRFCARCETTSFFGPFGWTALGPGPLTIETSRERRQLHPSPWAADALAASGDASEDFGAALARFAAAGYPERVETLAGLKTAFEALTGQPAERGAGQMYADRAVFVEDCVDGGMPATLPAAPLTEALRAIESVASRCQLLASESQSEARALLARHVPPASRVGLRALAAAGPAFARELREEAPRLASHRDRAAHGLFPELFDALASGKRHVEMSSSKAGIPPAAGWCDAFSPDILIAAKDTHAVASGAFDVILGEVHSTAGIFGYYLDYHAHPAALLDAWRSVTAGAEGRPYGFRPKCRTRLDLLYHPRPDVVVHEGQERDGVHLDDLSFERRGDDVALRVPGGPEACWLEAGRANEGRFFPLGLFTRAGFRTDSLEDALLGERGHVPRISLGRVTLIRESWRFRTRELASFAKGDGAALLHAADALRTSVEMPRFVFLRGDRSPKPVAVDLDSPLALEVAAREIRRAQHEVIIREMLPGPQHLWYRMNGHGYCSELRLTVFRRGR